MLNKANGFSLIELMIVVVIAAILLAVAVPSFDALIRSNRVQAHLSELRSNLAYARSVANDGGRRVVVCGSDDGDSCNNSNIWSSGLMIFVDDGAGTGTPGDGILNGDEEILRTYKHSGDNVVTITSSDGLAMEKISYTTQGKVNTRATVKLCESSGQVQYARALWLEANGNVTASTKQDTDGVFTDVNGNALSC